MLLHDRVALIVGGGNGLGRAIARRFFSEGAALAVADLNHAAAIETVQLSQGPQAHLALRADVSDERSCRDAVDATVARFGRLDILVN